MYYFLYVSCYIITLYIIFIIIIFTCFFKKKWIMITLERGVRANYPFILTGKGVGRGLRGRTLNVLWRCNCIMWGGQLRLRQTIKSDFLVLFVSSEETDTTPPSPSGIAHIFIEAHFSAKTKKYCLGAQINSEFLRFEGFDFTFLQNDSFQTMISKDQTNNIRFFFL